MEDKRELLYNNLIKSGKVTSQEIGSLDDFRKSIKDSASAGQFYENLIGAGFTTQEIGKSNDFISSIAPDFNIPAQSDGNLKISQGNDVSTQIMTHKSFELPKNNPFDLNDKRDYSKENVIQPSSPVVKNDAIKQVKPLKPIAKKVDQKKMYREIEEKGLDDNFKAKPVNNYDDIKENYMSRFSLTQEGKDAAQDINDAKKALSDTYSIQFKKSKEYNDIMSSSAIPADKDKALTVIWDKVYAPKIERSLEPYYRSYYDTFNNRYGNNIISESESLASKKTVNSWNGIEDRINQYEKEISVKINKRKSSHNMIEAFGNVKINTNAFSPAISSRNKEYAQVSAAKSMMDNSRKLIQAANDEKDGTFVGGVLRGTRDEVFNIDNWTMGLKGLDDGKVINDVLIKYEKGGKLTKEEELLMDAVASNAATQAFFQGKLGRGYKAGQVTGQSLPFMLDMLTGVAAVSSATSMAGKGLMKYIAKNIAKSGIKRNLTKGGVGVAKGVLDSVIHTSTMGAARVGSNYKDREIGDVKFDVDDTPSFAGREGMESGTGALAKAFTSTALETQSELIGSQFAPMIGFAGKQVAKLPGFNKIPFDKMGSYLKGVTSTPSMQNVKGFLKQAQWHGVLGEYAEEVYNNIGSTTIGDMTPEQLTDLDQNIDTALGVGVMSVALGGISGGAFIKDRYKTAKEMKAFENKMQGVTDDFDTWKGSIDKLDIDGAKTFIKSIIADKELSSEEKTDEIKYIANTLKSKAFEDKEPEHLTDDEIEDNKASIYSEYQRANKVLNNVAPEDLRNKINNDEDYDLSEYPDNIKGAAVEYIAAKSDFDDYTNHVNNKIDVAKGQAANDVLETENKDMHAVVQVNSRLSEEPILIVAGNVAFDEDGKVIVENSSPALVYIDENGKKKQMTPNAITSLVQMENTESATSQAQDDAQQAIIDEENSQLSPDFIPQVGDKVTLPGTETSGVVTQITPDGLLIDTGENVIQVDANSVEQFDDNLPQNEVKSENTPEVEDNNVIENVQKEPVTAKEETPEQKKERILQSMPMKGDKIDYNSMTPQQQFDYTSVTEDEETAIKDLKDDINQREKSLKKLNYKLKTASNRAEVRDQIRKQSSSLNSLKSLYEQVAPSAPEDITTDEEYISWIKDNSEDVKELSDAYNAAKELASQEIQLMPWQREILGRKVNTSSFYRFGDKNFVSGKLAKGWLRKDGEQIDTLAKEMSTFGVEITPQDVVDFIVDNPTNHVSEISNDMKDLSSRFSEVATKEMGFPIGGPESNTGKLYLQLKSTKQEIDKQKLKETANVDAVKVDDDNIDDYENNINDDFVASYDEAMKSINEEEADKLFPAFTPDDYDEIYSLINNNDGNEEIHSDKNEVEIPADNVGNNTELRPQGTVEVENTEIGEDGRGREETIPEGRGQQSGEQIKLTDNTLKNGDNSLSSQGDNQTITNDATISESVSQGDDGTLSKEDSGIEEALSECRRRSSEDERYAQADSGTLSKREQKEIENRATEEYAKDNGLWIPMQDVFSFGVPAPSGNENDVYLDTKDNSVYKVNNLMNSGNITSLLERLKLHNEYFPQTKYTLIGFSGFGGGDVFPVLKQDYIENATETSPEEIDNYMQSLEFKRTGEAEYSNGDITISDLRPRNVLKDTDGDIYVVDADFKKIKNSVSFGEKIAIARDEINTTPSDAQKEAGNYKKGHIQLDGYDITIENPKGGERSGTDKDGNKWSITMNNDYGYIKGTKGVDGDHIDMFLSDTPNNGKVFVVDQINPDGSFDEHKVMYGFDNAEEAKAAYLSNYSKGWKGLGKITEVSKEDFKKWIDSSTRKTKPFAEYKNIKTNNFDIQNNNDNIVSESRGNEKSYKTKDGEQLSFTFLQEESDKAFSTRQGSGEIRQENPLLGTKYLGRLKDGEFCKVERIFTKSKSFSFTSGETIETPEDIAYIFKNLEDSSIENSFAVFVKDGTPTVIHLGMGNFTSTTVTIPSIIAANNRINADQIYFVHNHPSGTLKASGEDINIYKKLKSIFKEKLQDAIIINLKSGKFAQFNDLNSSESMRRNPLKKVALTLYSFDKQVFAKDFDPSFLYQVRSANDIAGFISSHRLGYREKMSALILNNQLNVMGNVFLPYTSITKDNVEEITKEISEKVTALGGNRCVLYGRFAIDNTFNISEFASNFYINIVDVFDVRTNKSALDNDTLSEGIEDYENNIANEDGYSQALQDQQYFESNFNHCPILTIRSREDAYEQAKTLGMTDADAKEIKVLANDVEYAAVYIPEYKRMFIFADKGSNFRSSMFHENMHWAIDELFRNREDDFNTLYVSLYNSRPEDCDKIRELYEGESEFVKRNEVIANIAEVAFEKNKMNIVLDKIDGKGRSIFNEILNYIGYETEESTRGRISDNSRTYREDESGRQSMPNEGENSQESRGRESVEREIGETIDEIAKTLNTPVEIIRDVNEIKDDNKKIELRKRKAKGWFDPSTGKVVIVLPNATDEADVQATMLHEIVAHKGLKEMLGEDNFNTLCNNVFDSLPKDIQERLYDKYKSKTIAGDEYMASIAEEGCSPTLWEKIKGFVKDAFRKLSIDLKISDNDIKYLLWKSKNRLMKGDSDIDIINKVAKDAEQKEILFSSSFGGNSGYVGYSLSKRGARAKEEGRYPKTEFKREYELNDKTFKILSDVGIISGNEWHHTSMYGNKTTFYKWDDESYFDTYDANKSKINSLVKSIGKQPQMGNITTSEEMQEHIRQFDEWTKKRNKIKEEIANIFYEDDDSQVKYRELTDEDKSSTDNNGNFDRNNNDIRFRDDEEGETSDGSRERYEASLKGKKYNAQEAYQDSMLSVKKLQESIEQTTGDKIKSFEDVYTAENHLSSKNTAETREYYDKFFFPLETEIGNLIKRGTNYDDINKYLKAKHGLERNEVLAKRDADKIADDAYQKTIEQLKNLLSDGRLMDDEFEEKMSEAKDVREDTFEVNYNELRGKDYSGITSLFEADNLAESEKKAEDYIKDFEEKIDTSKLWNLINAATKETLKKTYESGIMSKDLYNQISGQFKYYIPLRGWNETLASDVYDYLQHSDSPVSPAVKGAKGRKSEADDPIPVIGNMAESAIIQGNKNLMKQTFLNLVMNHPTQVATVAKAWYIRNIINDWEISYPEIGPDDTIDDVRIKTEEHEQKMKELQAQGDAKQVNNGLKIDYKIDKYKAQEHAVRVKRNGNEYMIFVNGNPRAAQAINGLTNPDVENNTIINAIGRVNRWMAANFTTHNPAFVLSNLSRDLIFAQSVVLVKESPAYAAKFYGNIPSVMRAVAKGIKDKENFKYAEYFDEFVKNGGETGYMILNDVDKYKKKIASDLKKITGDKNSIVSAFEYCRDRLEDFNRWAEDISRFTTYVTSRQSGRSVVESIRDAKEITVNFNKKGAGAKTKGFFGVTAGASKSLYLFFNAAVQSLVNIGIITKEHPAKAMSLFGGFIAAGTLMPLVNNVIISLFGEDGDPYYDLPEWVRRNNLCLYAGNGKFVTIPLPIELRAFYGFGDIALSYMNKKTIAKPQQMIYDFTNQFTELLPINPIGNNGDIVSTFMPDASKPFRQLYVNKDFTGKPIYKKTAFNELDPEFKRVYKGTSGWLVNSSQFLNNVSGGNDFKKGLIDINPAKVEHIYEQYFGGMGKTFNQLFKTMYYSGKSLVEGEKDEDLVMRNVPVVNRFISSIDEKSSFTNLNKEYYEALDKYSIIEHEVNGLSKKASLMVPEYLEQYVELTKTEQYKQYMEFKAYKKQIDELSLIGKQLSDNERTEFDRQLMKLKQQAINAIQ